MSAAADLEKTLSGSESVAVPGDGTWCTRGHTALVGVVSVIGAESGKVLDVDVRCKECRACLSKQNLPDTPELSIWKEEHSKSCVKNHTGASGNMEVEGMLEVFGRSREKRGVMYKDYIGDGDSKVFKKIQESKPYGDDVEVNKLECVLHVQKRMGTRLRAKLKEKTKLAHGKGLGGKGRLTDKAVNRISSLYGKCIRDNSSNLDQMYKAVWALFDHTRSTDEEPFHEGCSLEWCRFAQELAATGKVVEYSHKNSVILTRM